MEKYKYIIVDDEYSSRLRIQHYLKNYSNYECAGVFINPQQALIFLQDQEIDLIFLDIEMPEMNGFQFLEILDKKIFVVIVTAYHDKYGLEAHQYYDKDLIFFSNKAQFSYYLPKIIIRFEKMHGEKELLNRVKHLSDNVIRIFPKKIEKRTVLLEDIVYFTVGGHYIVVKIREGDELVFRMTFRELMNILPLSTFLQIKRDTIINIGYVTAFTNTTVCVGNEHFNISIRNRERIVQALEAQKNLLCSNY